MLHSGSLNSVRFRERVRQHKIKSEHDLPIKHICNNITPIICEIDLNVFYDRHEIGHLASSIHVGEISPLKRFTHHLNGPQDIGTNDIVLSHTTVGSIHTLGNGHTHAPGE